MNDRTLYVKLDNQLHRRLKVRAAEDDISLRVVVTAAIAAYLDDAPRPSTPGPASEQEIRHA